MSLHILLVAPGLNAVEGFFTKLTRRRLKHGVFHSVVDLQAAINRFISEDDAENPQSFIWKASPMTSSPPKTDGSKRWKIHSHDCRQRPLA